MAERSPATNEWLIVGAEGTRMLVIRTNSGAKEFEYVKDHWAGVVIWSLYIERTVGHEWLRMGFGAGDKAYCFMMADAFKRAGSMRKLCL